MKSLLEIALMAIFNFIRVLFHNTNKSLELCGDKLIDVMKHIEMQKHLSSVAFVLLLSGALACEKLDDNIDTHSKGDAADSVTLDQVVKNIAEDASSPARGIPCRGSPRDILH